MAARTQAEIIHRFLRHAGLGELQDQGSGHVEKMLPAMGGVRPAEAGPGKRGFESSSYLGANFEAAAPDSRADCDEHVGRIHAEFVLHACQGLGKNAREGPAPAGVHGCDCAGFRIRNEHWKAIRHLDGQRDTALRSHERVTARVWIPLVRSAYYDMKLGGVDLCDGGQAVGSEAES